MDELLLSCDRVLVAHIEAVRTSCALRRIDNRLREGRAHAGGAFLADKMRFQLIPVSLDA